MIKEFAKYLTERILYKSRQVFYSGRMAFSKKTIYIFGLNNGGDPEIQSKGTVK